MSERSIAVCRKGLGSKLFLAARPTGWVVLFTAAMTFANGPTMAAPVQPEPRAISPDAVGLSGKEFFAFYTDTDRARRDVAGIYLLGVLDSTEGKRWCDYRTLQSVTLREFIFEYFRKLPAQRLEERASKLIEEALRAKFTCKGKP